MIAFYETITDQYAERNKGTLYRNLCPSGRIIPFQFVLPTTQKEITSVTLVGCGNITDITQKMKDRGLTIVEKNGKNILIYPAKTSLLGYVGTYYLEVVIGNRTFYSEVFTMTTEPLVKIVFSNDTNLQMSDTEIIFENFNFEFYASTTISKPTYSYEEEATQRGGYTFIESQVSKKTYRASFLATEHICDRLRLVKLCSKRLITSAGKTYKPLVFNFNTEWLEDEELANVSIEFEIDNVIARAGGYTDAKIFKRDYNDSYNQDFS